jgi:hypothetical protein
MTTLRRVATAPTPHMHFLSPGLNLFHPEQNANPINAPDQNLIDRYNDRE